MKKALIFGVTGQDGISQSFCCKFIVHQIKRNSSSLATFRIDDIYTEKIKKINLTSPDITDAHSINKLISKIKIDERL